MNGIKIHALCFRVNRAFIFYFIDTYNSNLRNTNPPLLFFFFFWFLGLHQRHMEVPRLGVESEL